MKQSLNKDTLAFQFGVRPAVQHRDISGAYLPDVVSSLNTFMAGNLYDWLGSGSGEKACGNPERDALVFYMMNHAVSLIRQKKHPFEPLGSSLPIVEKYHDQLAVRSARMFFYLLLICARESRHEKNQLSGTFWSGMANKYPKSIIKFHEKIRTISSSLSAASVLTGTAPDCTLGQFTNYLSETFRHGHYSGGFGGHAWAAVADVLRDFVHGKITAEMMMDTAFTLAHNNGPIFNKGMLFDGYTSEIYTLLDVQRAGQIPQYIGNKESAWGNDALLHSLWNLCSTVLSKEFSGYVDWYLVEELGALKTYTSQKNAQTQQHGFPSKFKAKMEAEKLKQEAEAKAKLEGMKDWVYIMPNLKIKKVQVPR